jgi:hypothetical protein
MSKTFSVADVASHKDAGSGMYIIVDENVYDVTGICPLSFLHLLLPPNLLFSIILA